MPAVPSAVQSIERAFSVLHAVATGPAGITELARRVDLPTSTVARLLATLENLRVVERFDDGLTYRIGSTIGELAAAVDTSASLVERAYSFLGELAERTGETAGLSVLSGNEVRYLKHVESENQIQVRGWDGVTLPLHVVSSGLVLLANRPVTEISAYLSNPLVTSTSFTVTDPAKLAQRLEQIRADGYVWTIKEFDEGLSSVAAPVWGANGKVVAAIAVHGPSYRFPPDGKVNEVRDAVVEVAGRLTALLQT